MSGSPGIRHGVPCKFRALTILAALSRRAASYPLPVRQASALPSASSRFAVVRDTLAVRLTLPLAGRVEDSHLQVSAPCRAHQKKGRDTMVLPFCSRWLQRAYSFSPSASSVNKIRSGRSSLSCLYPVFRVYLWWSGRLLRRLKYREEEPKNATSCSPAQGMFQLNVPVGKPALYRMGTIFLLRCRPMLSCRLLDDLRYSLLYKTVDDCHQSQAKNIPFRLLPA